MKVKQSRHRIRVASNDPLGLRMNCCDAFQQAFKMGSDNEGYSVLFSEYDLRSGNKDGNIHIGYGLPPISFCPWCGSLKTNPNRYRRSPE